LVKCFSKIAVFGLVLAGLAVVAVFGWEHRVDIVAIARDTDPVFAVVAVLMLALSNVGAGLAFSSIISRELGRAAPRMRVLLGVFLYSQVAKYVPGKVWGVVLQRQAVGPSLTIDRLLRVNLDLAVLSLSTTFGAAVVFASANLFGFPVGAIVGGIVLSLIWMGVAARPSVRIQQVLGWLSTRFRSSDPEPALPGLQADPRFALAIALAFSAYCVGWLVLVLAVSAQSVEVSLRVAAMLSLSQSVGILSLLPAGLGAREAFIVASSSWTYPDAAFMTFLAISSRLVMVLVDLVCLVSAILISKFAPALREGAPE